LEVFTDSKVTGIFRDIAKADEWLGLTKVKRASRRKHSLPAP
jgi:hypothetical protein